jgi:hypothetical protein
MTMKTNANIKAATKALFAYSRDPSAPLASFGLKPTLVQGENGLVLSAEDGRCFADYYMEYGLYRDTFGIDPDLVRIAEEHGCYWEWMNAGAAVLCE